MRTADKFLTKLFGNMINEDLVSDTKISEHALNTELLKNQCCFPPLLSQ